MNEVCKSSPSCQGPPINENPLEPASWKRAGQQTFLIHPFSHPSIHSSTCFMEESHVLGHPATPRQHQSTPSTSHSATESPMSMAPHSHRPPNHHQLHDMLPPSDSSRSQPQQSTAAHSCPRAPNRRSSHHPHPCMPRQMRSSTPLSSPPQTTTQTTGTVPGTAPQHPTSPQAPACSTSPLAHSSHSPPTAHSPPQMTPATMTTQTRSPIHMPP